MHHLFQHEYDYIYRWAPYRKNQKKKRVCKIKDEDKNLEMEFESFVSKQEVSLFGATLKFSMKFDFFLKLRFRLIKFVSQHMRLYLLFNVQLSVKS